MSAWATSMSSRRRRATNTRSKHVGAPLTEGVRTSELFALLISAWRFAVHLGGGRREVAREAHTARSGAISLGGACARTRQNDGLRRSVRASSDWESHRSAVMYAGTHQQVLLRRPRPNVEP